MQTINISLPVKLKKQAQELVKSGIYASFSDLVRDSIRQTIKMSRYDLLAEEAKKEEREGKIKPLKTKKDIEDFVNSL